MPGQARSRHPARRSLSAAHAGRVALFWPARAGLATALASGGQVAKRSLFDLPLGPAPLWEITERPAPVEAPDGREQQCTAVLPAWSAHSLHDLTRDPGPGFGAAAATLAGLLNQDRLGYQARQAAAARYGRTGFEAAAVTGVAGLSAHITRPGLLRTAELRFGQPFAVVAVTAERDPHLRRDAVLRSPWHGLPVFPHGSPSPKRSATRHNVSVRHSAQRVSRRGSHGCGPARR